MPLLHDLVLEMEDLIQDKESLVRWAPLEAITVLVDTNPTESVAIGET